jgi:hypothetical protein
MTPLRHAGRQSVRVPVIVCPLPFKVISSRDIIIFVLDKSVVNLHVLVIALHLPIDAQSPPVGLSLMTFVLIAYAESSPFISTTDSVAATAVVRRMANITSAFRKSRTLSIIMLRKLVNCPIFTRYASLTCKRTIADCYS